ncbi:MAG TPA: hypothetical protein VGK24_13270 [Candidatus Angelobacter sp.]|jgi:hypothetical protein
MADTICPDCGLEMDQIEKTTFTGRDMREYQCKMRTQRDYRSRQGFVGDFVGGE